MSKILKKRSRKSGLAPGSLVHLGKSSNEKIVISLFDYSATHATEKTNLSIQECLPFLNSSSTTWIDIQGIHDIHTIEKIGHYFGLHPLLLEDIVNSGQRSKLDNYKDNVFIVMRLLKYNSIKNEVEDEQVSLILGKSYVLSFMEGHQTIFKLVAERLRNKNSLITQRGADYLCYALIDCLVDHYFVILEKVDDKLEELEEELISYPSAKSLHKIQHTKREITLLRKSIWPLREVINHFRRLELPFIHESTKLYMQDVYDHTIQAIDTIESFRDISSGLLDIYLSNISLKMNEIMKVLTVVSTIFVPLTFIASLYGMNFYEVPELKWQYGYHFIVGLMGVTLIFMLYYFRRKDWI